MHFLVCEKHSLPFTSYHDILNKQAHISTLFKGVIVIDIIINTDSIKPIYEQIKIQIKAKVLSGNLKTGDPIPSMRSLAKSLKIGVITVQRAYEDLQKEGFIETAHGKGSFISARNLELSKCESYQYLESTIKKIVDHCVSHSIEIDDLIELVRIIHEEKSNGTKTK